MPKVGSETKSYSAACVQFNVERSRVQENLASAVAGIRSAAAANAQLIVLPEMWTTSFVSEPTIALIRESREAERVITRLAGELGVMIVGSALEEERGRYYNRSQIIDQGKVLGNYRKIHLFTPNAEHRQMSAGTAPLILDTRLGRIGAVICYDIRFPELIRYYFHHGVQVLTVPAQWPEARANHWRTLTKARAIENQMYVLGCNRTGSEESMRNEELLVFPGDSRVVDPMGDVVAAAEGEPGPLLAEVELRRCRTMQRIMPVHRDRRPRVYRDLWQPIWANPKEPKVPEVPTIDEARPPENG